MSTRSSARSSTRASRPLVHLHRLMPRRRRSRTRCERDVELRMPRGLPASGARLARVHAPRARARPTASASPAEGRRSPASPDEPARRRATAAIERTLYRRPTGGEASGPRVSRRSRAFSVWAEGYSHHITRLMVLVEPRDACSTCRRATSPTGSGSPTPTPTTGSSSRTCWRWGPSASATCSRPSRTSAGRPTSHRMSDYCARLRLPPEEDLPDHVALLGLPREASRAARRQPAPAHALRQPEEALGGAARSRSRGLRAAERAARTRRAQRAGELSPGRSREIREG